MSVLAASLLLVCVQAAYYQWRQEKALRAHRVEILAVLEAADNDRSGLLDRIQHPEIVRAPATTYQAEPQEPDDIALVGTIGYSDA